MGEPLSGGSLGECLAATVHETCHFHGIHRSAAMVFRTAQNFAIEASQTLA
jgi:hypothetical protein